ncbi:MAG: hypothetical protein AB2693_28010 [Candidatus Thiodiazotropha sp.]
MDKNFVIGFDRCALVLYEKQYGQVLCKRNLHISTRFDTGTYANHYAGFQQRLLNLSQDIESNPGPGDMEKILTAIQASEDRLLGEIRSVKSEIMSIKDDIVSIKNDQVKTKLEINSIKQSQIDMSSDIDELRNENKLLSELTEQMQLDIDFLSDSVDYKTKSIEQLEDDFDRLDARARSDTMRVFGLPVLHDETIENIRQHVIQNVLKVACPALNWESDDLKRVYRVGGGKDNQPPVLIVCFRYDDDKAKVFAGREELRKHGIRVSNDLTLRQREKLKALKSKGKIGYFYKGRLIERSTKVSDFETAGRVFRKANRRIELIEHAEGNQSKETENELIETSDDMSVENNEDEVLTVDGINNENDL